MSLKVMKVRPSALSTSVARSAILTAAELAQMTAMALLT